MLTLDGHSIIIMVNMSFLSCRASFQPVSGINLHTRLSSNDFQTSSAGRRIKFSCRLKLSRLHAVDDETVIVALSVVQCRKISLDVASDSLGIDKIHRGAGDILRLSRRDERVIGRQILGRVQLQDVIQHGSGALAVEIEI